MEFPNLKETHFLESLWWGLDHLARETKNIEDRVRERLQVPAGHVVVFSRFGGGPQNTVVLNYFVWYSNSLITFLKLFAKAYPAAEDWAPFFSGVLKWRNKVAAHTAYTDPKLTSECGKRLKTGDENAVGKKAEFISTNVDNVYSQEVSIMMTPDWANDRFAVGRWMINGADGYSHNDWAWSLTTVHSELVDYIGRNKK